MRKGLARAALAGYLALLGAGPVQGASPGYAQTHPAAASDITLPVSDARNVGAKAVRLSAAQFTKDGPTIVIFGVTKENWPRLKAAIQQAVFEGSPVAGVFIGPAGSPGIEIYAKGMHVTNPLDPDTISGPALTRAIRDVWREYYG